MEIRLFVWRRLTQLPSPVAEERIRSRFRPTWDTFQTMRPRLRPLALALGVSTACQGPEADSSPFPTAPMTAALGSSASADTGTAGSSGSGSASTTGQSTGSASGESGGGTTLLLDVGSDQDLGINKPPGCEGKIDFLFVISRGLGMEYFQTQLLAAFPKFIDTIQAKFTDFDYHIMVVDGDPTWGLSTCDAQCPVQCVPDYPCGYTPTTCDKTMGAGVVFPAGDDAANALCKIDGNRRYMVKGQTDLTETFACTAQVGSSGRGWIGEALTAAVHSNINDPGGCNPGFLRDDALLMVTLISSSYDQDGGPKGSSGTPETWTAAVRKAKGDDLSSVVMFSILDPSYEPGCHPEDRTCQMVRMFPYSLITSVLVDDYGPAFEQAAALVETACADFVPG